jgi:hypothetical protein
MITTLDHIQLAMPAGCESEARKYYGELLRLTEINKPPALQARGGVWFVLGDGRQLHLGVEVDFRPNKKTHLCFVTDQYQALIDLLKFAGHDIQHDTMNPPVNRFYTHDVFGNRLEFADQMSPPANSTQAD